MLSLRIDLNSLLVELGLNIEKYLPGASSCPIQSAEPGMCLAIPRLQSHGQTTSSGGHPALSHPSWPLVPAPRNPCERLSAEMEQNSDPS